MSAELNVIKCMYEDEGLSPEFIAEDRSLDLVAVKAALMQSSTKYRKDCGAEDDNEDVLNFSKDEQLRVKNMMLDLALGADDEHLRAKMCVIVRDDAKGRRDIAKGLANGGTNVFLINKLLSQGRSAADEIKNAVLRDRQQKAINV